MECAKIIYQAGITEVIWRNSYRTEAGINFLNNAGVTMEQLYNEVRL
jgi:deoxycytidylate deaminase